MKEGRLVLGKLQQQGKLRELEVGLRWLVPVFSRGEEITNVRVHHARETRTIEAQGLKPKRPKQIWWHAVFFSRKISIVLLAAIFANKGGFIS